MERPSHPEVVGFINVYTRGKSMIFPDRESAEEAAQHGVGLPMERPGTFVRTTKVIEVGGTVIQRNDHEAAVARARDQGREDVLKRQGNSTDPKAKQPPSHQFTGFILVTRYGDGRVVRINAHRIDMIIEDDDGVTGLFMPNGNELKVNEPPETILKRFRCSKYGWSEQPRDKPPEAARALKEASDE